MITITKIRSRVTTFYIVCGARPLENVVVKIEEHKNWISEREVRVKLVENIYW